VIVLPFPHKALWPNGRSHWAVKAREAKKLRQEAAWATKAASLRIGDSPIPLHITVHPKRTGPAPDRDNIIAAAKHALDGIADALGINDRHFAAPTVTISNQRTGQFIIEVGEVK
jgi:crossover junction endodeoxyribonuclease RusA